MKRARRKPNRHQGSANLNRPRVVGTVGGTRGGLSPNRVAPAAPAPAAGPAPGPPPPPPGPVDPFAVRTGDSASTIEGIGAAGAGYQRAIVSGAAARATLLRNAGVEEYTDPATGRAFRLNAAGNPYSEAGRLGVQFQQRKRGTNTSMGAAGMLFDGGYGRAVEADNRAEGEATTDLINRVTAGVGQIESGGMNAFSDAMGSIYGYRRDDAQNAAATIKDPTPKPKGPPKGKPGQKYDWGDGRKVHSRPPTAAERARHKGGK